MFVVHDECCDCNIFSRFTFERVVKCNMLIIGSILFTVSASNEESILVKVHSK
jgi:hypothetical protein